MACQAGPYANETVEKKTPKIRMENSSISIINVIIEGRDENEILRIKVISTLIGVRSYRSILRRMPSQNAYTPLVQRIISYGLAFLLFRQQIPTDNYMNFLFLSKINSTHSNVMQQRMYTFLPRLYFLTIWRSLCICLLLLLIFFASTCCWSRVLKSSRWHSNN